MGKYRAAGIEWLFSGYYQTKNNNIKRVLVSIKIYKGYFWYARRRVAEVLSIKVLNNIIKRLSSAFSQSSLKSYKKY